MLDIFSRFVVYGLGISGISVAKFLVEDARFSDATIILTDDNPRQILQAQASLPHLTFLEPGEISYDGKTAIIFSPGIPLYFPTRHKILEIARSSGASLFCDIELFYLLNQGLDFIGITGTNGKSTTTALTGFVFKALSIPSFIGGNIGNSCFNALISKDEPAVPIIELSSYQLDLTDRFRLGVAALMNITPDHIDRHGSMEAYIKAKKRIFNNQTIEDFALIDVDNENSRKVFELLVEKKSNNLIPVSTELKQTKGVTLKDGILYNRIGGIDYSCELKSSFLRGKHNEQNMAFAFAIAYSYHLRAAKIKGLSLSEANLIELQDKIVSAIKEFKGLRHRMQIVDEVDGIRFINDSKATNAESTKNALLAYDDIFWILGGVAKDGGIESLTSYFDRVRKAYLIGEASDQFSATLAKKTVEFEKCYDLKSAFNLALMDARNSGLVESNILLSPACASFDQWKNFEQRGDYFCELVAKVKK